MTIIRPEARPQSGRGRRRRVSIYLALGAIVLVSAGVVLVLRGLESKGSAQPAAASSLLPASQPAAGAASQPAAGTKPPRALTTAATLPPAAGGGDHYARNVTPGATCAPVGARGFTAHGKVVRCATTSSDPRPRWRP